MGKNETTPRKRSVGRTPEYQAFKVLKNRCYNTNYVGYKTYGAKGITIEFDNFTEFLNEVGDKPGDGYAIYRHDITKNYAPGNIYWGICKGRPKIREATPRKVKLYECDGVAHTVKEWSVIIGISYHSMIQRFLKYDVVTAITKKPKISHNA